MKKIMCCLFLISMVALLPQLGNAVYQTSTIDVPEDLVLPEGALSNLQDSFFRTTDFDNQVRVVVAITKVMNVTGKKYDVLEKIAMWDISGGIQSSNTGTQARVIAISNIASSYNSKYTESMIKILTVDKTLDPRIEAARALGKIAISNTNMSYAITSRLVELIKDPQKYSFQNFNRSDRQNKYFDDDRIVEAMVVTIGDIGDPKAFTALLKIVTERNHRDETIDAAWFAMKRLKW